MTGWENKIRNRAVLSDISVITALKRMDDERVKLLLVFEKEEFLGLLTIGDIQRAIIAGNALSDPIEGIMDRHKEYAGTSDSIDQIKERILAMRAECMPVVDEDGKLVNVYFWNDFWKNNVPESMHATFDLPVVIMAGGMGTRMRPLTNIFPKPLLPISEKTIIEEIMDRFVAYGSNHFYLSVNYKADVIKRYFENSGNNNYRIEYFQEPRPLGTIGSLYLIKNKIDRTFFISNCDILIEEDYAEILKYHRENGNEITVVAALKNYPIPYGVLETSEGGKLEYITEKPDITFKINTGVYILEPHLLHEIPEDQFYHITQLIEKVSDRGGRVGVFPVSEKSWTDIGDWHEYLKVLNY